MEEESLITHEEYLTSAELFRSAFPTFAAEVERVEARRGRLNDFQLMQAVSKATDSIVILGWNCRKTVAAMFDVYAEIYRREGREAADKWVEATFGVSYSPEAGEVRQSLLEAMDRVHILIKAKEAELQLLYRELHELRTRLEEPQADMNAAVDEEE